MPGFGSPSPRDRGPESGRVVHRDSGMQKSSWKEGQTTHEIEEYRPPVGTNRTSDRGTRFRYNVTHSNIGGGVWGNRQGDVKTAQRAKTAATGAGKRLQMKYLMGG
jgi:hypothetical protein